MGFSGGGSNVLKPHKHSSAVQDGSPLNMNNVTEATLSAGDIVYSDGAALQRLGIGPDTTVLSVSGSTPSWSASTSNPLIKVTKTFADINIPSTSMDIYTLPQNAALVNVFTDITTVFDVSTGVTIGDAGDDNGFQEATDWTSGVGLSDATRGAYVTTFKTMRSVSGTTAIKAYNFSTATAGGSTFSQLLGGDSRSIANGIREELAQAFDAGHAAVGGVINAASWWIAFDQGSPTGNIQGHLRQADGTLIETSPDTVDASTVGAETEYTFNFSSSHTLLAGEMITVSLDNGALGPANTVFCRTNAATMTDGTLWQTNSPGSAYTELVGTQMKMTVVYDASITSDTQGEVDFYLQVVD